MWWYAKEDKTAPAYMETAPENYIDAMTLYQSEVDSGEAVTVADLTPDQIGQYWAVYDSFHAVVPERVLHAGEGSRADVLEAATWSNGVWTAEYQRKLVTGNADDVQFDDLSKSYLFATTIMDNAGGDNHDLSDTLETLQFVPAALPVSGGVLVWPEIAAVGLIVVGVLSLATGVVGFFVSRRRAS
ncbi:MAG TPA: hypothetical protein EYP49_13010 [Anaerolineae bacterium]|nr:hypothetical protein [Anaerolineae bacterium]